MQAIADVLLILFAEGFPWRFRVRDDAADFGKLCFVRLDLLGGCAGRAALETLEVVEGFGEVCAKNETALQFGNVGVEEASASSSLS